MTTPELKVYTDISCVATDKNFYKHLKKCLNQHPAISDRILFGSDFSINLLWTESYGAYYKTYCDNLGSSNQEMSRLFGSINPEKYLFT